MPDGNSAVSASNDNTIEIWELENGEMIATFSADAEILSFSISPRRPILAASDRLGMIHFLELENYCSNLLAVDDQRPMHLGVSG